MKKPKFELTDAELLAELEQYRTCGRGAAMPKEEYRICKLARENESPVAWVKIVKIIKNKFDKTYPVTTIINKYEKAKEIYR